MSEHIIFIMEQKDTDGQIQQNVDIVKLLQNEMTPIILSTNNNISPINTHVSANITIFPNTIVLPINGEICNTNGACIPLSHEEMIKVLMFMSMIPGRQLTYQ